LPKFQGSNLHQPSVRSGSVHPSEVRLSLSCSLAFICIDLHPGHIQNWEDRRSSLALAPRPCSHLLPLPHTTEINVINERQHPLRSWLDTGTLPSNIMRSLRQPWARVERHLQRSHPLRRFYSKEQQAKDHKHCVELVQNRDVEGYCKFILSVCCIYERESTWDLTPISSFSVRSPHAIVVTSSLLRSTSIQCRDCKY
jgi:hypothetical protein